MANKVWGLGVEIAKSPKRVNRQTKIRADCAGIVIGGSKLDKSAWNRTARGATGKKGLAGSTFALKESGGETSRVISSESCT